MDNVIKILSFLIIFLGLIHIGFAFPLYMNADTLWFVGSGLSIVFAGLLNLVAIDGRGSRFSRLIAILVNALTCAMFSFALAILNEPQVYMGIALFLFTTLAFIIDASLNKQQKF